MYTDDTLLTYSNGNIHSIQSSLSEDFRNINRWLIANELTLTMIKTDFMLTGSRQKLNNLPSLPSLNINNVPITHSQCFKSLGVLIDENLTWKNHADALSKKIASDIGAMKRTSHCLPPTALHDVYYGLVQSHFDYCSVVWGNCCKSLRDKLRWLQHRAAHVLTLSNKRVIRFILSTRFTFIVERSWKNMHFHSKMAWPPATYDVISCDHSSWSSLKLSQNAREE